MKNFRHPLKLFVLTSFFSLFNAQNNDSDTVIKDRIITQNESNSDSKNQDSIQISKNDVTKENIIENVTITKTKVKPMLQRKDGKTILNLESSVALSGSSVFDILEKSPGIKVDGNDQILYKGQGNVLVQIDGKNTAMSGGELASYLKGVSSQNVENIEFISNPSAKYDASGSSIINIVLKKNKNRGTNGSFRSMVGSGKLFNTSHSLQLNHNTEKINYYLNYGFNYRKIFSNLILTRRFYNDNNEVYKIYDQDNYMEIEYRTQNAKFGIDYELNNKNSLGLSFGYIGNNFSSDGDNFASALNAQNIIEYNFETKSRTHNDWNSYAINLNHLMKLDNKKSVLSTDLDHIFYRNISLQNFKTQNSLANGNPTTHQILHGDSRGNLDIYSLKSDVKKYMDNDLIVEFGIKSSYVKADNDLDFFDVTSGTPVNDLGRTNSYLYEENINALFASANKKWSKWTTNFGIRLENTNITGLQRVNNEKNKKQYTQFFPNLQFQHTFNDDHSFDISYSRRINRPTYVDLNPFKFYADPTTYKSGNPELRPQISNNIELTYTFKNKYLASLTYSAIKDNITTVLKPIIENGENVVAQIPENLDSAKFLTLHFSLPMKFNKWWEVNHQIFIQHGLYSGDISNTIIKDLGNTTLMYNMLHNFKIKKDLSAELVANYQSREVYAFMDIKARFDVNIGAQKKFGKNNQLKLNFNNIFYRPHIVAKNNYHQYSENFKVLRDTRQFLLTYTYNFGIKQNQQRKTGGADDLQKRAG